ncbi:MAG TPA: class E sortase [Streptosporangiaceae bacterium]
MLILFIAYDLWGTGVYTQNAQRDLTRDLQHDWGSPSGGGTADKIHLVDGHGFAVIRIPRFGKRYHFVILEGTSEATLRRGPGHYKGTALPGRRGNFVVSGHRTTYEAPFNKAGELRHGDEIIVDTKTREYVYKVTETKVVVPTDVAVTYPVPFHRDATPRHAMITLTTCHPMYSATHRLIIFGRLAERRARTGTTGEG